MISAENEKRVAACCCVLYVLSCQLTVVYRTWLQPVRIYSEDILRSRVASAFPDALCWKPLGLPEDFLPLLAPGRRAFVLNGQRTVAHGGITLEEMVVPFVRVIEGRV